VTELDGERALIKMIMRYIGVLHDIKAAEKSVTAGGFTLSKMVRLVLAIPMALLAPITQVRYCGHDFLCCCQYFNAHYTHTFNAHTTLFGHTPPRPPHSPLSLCSLPIFCVSMSYTTPFHLL